MESQVVKKPKENQQNKKTVLMLQIKTAKTTVDYLKMLGYEIIYSEDFTDESKKYSVTSTQILATMANTSQKFFIDNALEDLILSYNFNEFTPKFCCFCNQIETDKISLKACGKCKKVYYCNTECQKNHWQKHKISCHSSK